MSKVISNIIIGSTILVIGLGVFLGIGLLTAAYPLWLTLPGGILFSYLAYGVGDLFREEFPFLRKEKSKD